MPQQPYLLADGLTYELPPDRVLFRDVQVSLFAGDRIALVGANGVGKSTLLQILADQISPTAGAVQRNGSVYYLPQISTIRQQLKQDTVLNTLCTLIEEWWNVTNLLETQFNTVLDLSLPIADLSGGELTKLFLAIGLSQDPQVLLLDEPTNHMDFFALEELRQFLQQFKGAFVIVSHKPFFLDQVVETTWELTPNGLTVYGGNFSLYREQQQTELEAKLRSHEVARKELKRAKTSAQQEQARAARSSHYGRHHLADSMPRIVAGAYQRKAEVTAGKLKQKHEVAIAKASQKVMDTKVKTEKTTLIQLEERNQKHRNLIEIQQANLWVAERLLIQNIQLHVASGDRIAIAGANGCGKSSFAKALLNRLETPVRSNTEQLKSGQVLLSPNLKGVYLDQTYELVDRRLTVLENLQTANPELSYQWLRQQLGHFRFCKADVNKSASVLSGGELARLAIAMISVSQVDLLMLDEPTNNLDIPTVDQMIDALQDYQGALLVISHDLHFLSQINLTGAFKVVDRTLQQTTHLPNQPELYYQELIH